MKQRFLDLANTCYQQGRYTFSHFLSSAEIDEFLRIRDEVSFVGYTLYGGSEFAERQMLRFGNEDMFGYVEPFPVCCIHCCPVTPKFAEEPGHRDMLGALMNLGIQRDVLGDIWIKEKDCYFFCMASMKEYICDNLTKVRHTNVICKEISDLPPECKPKREREEYIVSSERCDALVSKVYNLSRSRCILLFQEKKIFVNSRLYENNSGTLKKGDIVSVRGYGKFSYCGILRETKKGRQTVAVEKYI